ncbi:transmembrane and coiled-coil domain-containing protein 4, partial [Octopus bimaculoides]
MASCTEASPTEANSTETTSTEASSTEASSTEASSTEASSTEASSTEASSTEAISTEATSTEASSTEASSTEASSTEVTSTKASSTEVTSTEVTSIKASSTEVTSTKASSTEVTSTEASSTEVTSTEASSTEVTSTEVTSTKASSTEVTSTKASSTEASSTKVTSTEASSTEVTSTETNSTEVTSTKASSTEVTSTEASLTEVTSTETSSTEDVPKADTGEDLKAKPLTSTLKQMTDAGQFSYSSICALALKVLFDDRWHQSYKNDALTKIFNYFDQPKQVRVNIKAFLEGHGSYEVDPYIEVLLHEEVLKESLLPLVVELIPLLINNGRYDARSRVLAKHLAWLFRINWDDIIDFEKTFSEQLKTDAYRVSQCLTGGLAAPLVAAGAGAIIGGAGAAALATTTGLAVISSLFGVAGAGLTGYKMKRRVGAVEEFVFEPLVPGLRLQTENMGKQLHITIAVNGWLNNTMKDYKEPWQTLNESLEQYSLRWESRYLLELGKAFEYMVGMAIGVATQEVLKYTILSGYLKNRPKVAATKVWTVRRGCRPVSLIGYSLGARVIYCCLEELSKRKGCEGIVEDVILLGAPVSAKSSNWEQLQRVVSGKLINGYCRADWLLKFLYRSSSMQFQIAGLMPVKLTHHCMHNIDLSDVVKGHLDYMKKLD